MHIVKIWKECAPCAPDTLLCLFHSLSLQVVCVPEIRCFQTACPPVPPPVRLRSHLGLLQPWDNVGRSVSGVVSVHPASTFNRDAVLNERTVLVSTAGASTNQVTRFSRGATPGKMRLFLFPESLFPTF